jgi:hypothetical protein
MSKHEKSRKKSKEPTKESANENNDSEYLTNKRKHSKTQKNYKENFSKLINDKVCGLANLIPSPFKAPSKLILQKTVHPSFIIRCLSHVRT